MQLILGKRKFSGIKPFINNLFDGELPLSDLKIELPSVVVSSGAAGSGSDLYMLQLVGQAIEKNLSVVFIDRSQRARCDSFLSSCCKGAGRSDNYFNLASLSKPASFDKIRSVVSGRTSGVLYYACPIIDDFLGKHRYADLVKTLDAIHQGAKAKVNESQVPVVIVVYDALNHINHIANTISGYYQRANNLDHIKHTIEAIASQGRSLNLSLFCNEHDISAEYLVNRSCQMVLERACKIVFTDSDVNKRGAGDAVVIRSTFKKPYSSAPVIIRSQVSQAGAI